MKIIYFYQKHRGSVPVPIAGLNREVAYCGKSEQSNERILRCSRALMLWCGLRRDFAYVARDRSTRKHMCHVFRCDIPARTIANTLRDICKKIMIERSLQQNLAKPVDIGECTTGQVPSPPCPSRARLTSDATPPRGLVDFSRPTSSLPSAAIPPSILRFIQPASAGHQLLRCHPIGALLVTILRFS